MMWLTIASTILYAIVAEYVSHRWLMHRPYPWRHSRYIEHAIEHHGKGRNDVNIGLSPLTVMAVGCPLLLWSLQFGVSWIVAYVAICTAYAATWSMLHAAHHDLRFEFLKRIPGYKWLRRHHLLHHDHPNRNFGTLFPVSDFIFGTAVNAESEASESADRG